MRLPALAGLLLTGLSLAGCAAQYRPPSSPNVATLAGTGKQHREGLFGLWRGSIIVFKVDGVLVSGDPNSYREPVMLSAGKHDVLLAVERRLSDKYDRRVVEVGYRTVTVDLPAGGYYRICMRPAVRPKADPFYVTAWIEDSNGKRITNFMNMQLTRNSINLGLDGIDDEGLTTTC